MQENIMANNFLPPQQELPPILPIVHQSQIRSGTIKARHLEANLIAVQFGLAADRPTDASSGTFAYFATDTNALSCWNGTAWKSVTLT